ncbi:uncharacterized protein C8Q71DRAFT_422415 [Rhodofomes roseus]|uniref:F-box domain-containing protein n=1 Tax=Rhodofomes roseus TaxID=34475 RepID=A0ABQ8KQC2_9APHY|nr:uncharacterized protein C8Q71DRAFT_422415 [Rhodofomes roseus]KAH9840766.1 hypothetical protein C8Q71DRAFT_422415 [Rhodofomes roseus]
MPLNRRPSSSSMASPFPRNNVHTKASRHIYSRSNRDTLEQSDEHILDYRLPLELCEMIIDSIAYSGLTEGRGYWAQSEWRNALLACAFVCRAWHLRSMFHLHKSVQLANRKQVVSLSKRLRQHQDLQAAVEYVTISRAESLSVRPYLSGDKDHDGIGRFGTFIMMLARRLPNITSLTIAGVVWRTGSMHPECMRYLSTYTTITRLCLHYVTFTRTSQFVSLLSALPNLQCLDCADVKWAQIPLMLPVPLHAQRHTHHLILSGIDTSTISKSLLNGKNIQVGSHWQRLLDILHHVSACEVSMTLPSVRRIDLSQHSKLGRLSISYTYSAHASFYYIAATLSTITSDALSTIHVQFQHSAIDSKLSDLYRATDQWAKSFVNQMDHNDDLQRIDEILSGACFASITRGGVCFEITMNPRHHARIAQLTGSEEYWTQTLTQKMPRAAERGILQCVLTQSVR